MKKNAFTLVEVVLTLAVASVTLVTLFQIIFLVRNLYAGSGIKVKLLEKQLIINQKVNADFNFKKLLMLRKCSSTCLEFTFETGEIKRLSYDRNNKTFTYGDYSTKLVGQSVFGNIKMNTTTVYDTLLTDNSILLIDIPVYNPEFEGEDFGFHLVYQYNPKKTSVDNNYPFGGELSGHLYFRDKFITVGFEGLILRNPSAEYQFGKRNQAMFKFKKVDDGKFTIVDITSEHKRSDLPLFVCRNDINDELFECSINKPQDEQREILVHKEKYIGKLMLVEFRNRSGIKQCPFHARGINIINN